MSDASIGIEASNCLTPFGNAQETCEALLRGKIALQSLPVLGRDGGDLVPLASMGGYDESIPPRWESQIDQLESELPRHNWGSSQFPVFLTSSNFDVGSLYAYRNTGDDRFLKIGTPAKTLKYLQERYQWGDNVLALSHACVSGSLGIEMGCRHLLYGAAEKVLIFSFDFISPFVAGGFHSLKILNEQFPAPYQDREFGSIGLGDGAGFVVLSMDETRCRVKANTLYNEMYHFTANEPSGSGFDVMAEWLRNQVGDVPVWIKGHGTGTLDAGRLEADAFQKLMPNSPLVSWKGSLGHTLGSCGIVEMAVALAAIERGHAPGTVGSQLPVISPNVTIESIATEDFGGIATFSNAFGGAHAGCLITYE